MKRWAKPWAIGVLLFLGGWSVGRTIPSPPPKSTPPPANRESIPTSESKTAQPDSDLLAQIAAAPTSELGKLYESFPGAEHRDLDSLSAFRALVRRTVLEDPEILHDGTFTENQLQEIALVWLETDPAGFFERLPTLDGYDLQVIRRQAAFTAPREFVKFAQRSRDWPADWNQDLATAILGIAETSPREALDLLDQCNLTDGTSAWMRQPGAERDRFVPSVQSEVAAKLAAEDPESALEWARARSDPATRQQVVVAATAAWALDAPDAAADAFEDLAKETGMTLHGLASRMCSLDPEKSMLFFDRVGGDQGSLLILEFCNRIRDPESIRRVEDQLQGAGTRQTFRNELLRQWDDRSPEAGLDFALSAPPEEREAALRALAGNLGRSSHRDAAELAGRIGDSALREAYRESLRQGMVVSDPVRVIGLARATGDKEALVVAIGASVAAHSGKSEFPAREVLEWTREAKGRLGASSLQKLALRHYRENPKEAEAFVLSVENGSDRRALLHGLVRGMAGYGAGSAAAAADWVERLPEGEDREAAIGTVIGPLENSDPGRAFNLAGGIRDRDSRLACYGTSLSRWARRDPAAARAALDAAPDLSDKERARLATWIYAPR